MDNFILQDTDKVVESQYLIMNPIWEHKLQDFDPNLKILLDKENQRWLIAEFIEGNKYPNIVMYLEDESGKPKPFGDWVINKLFVKAQRWAARKNNGSYLDGLAQEAEKQKIEFEEKSSEEARYKIVDDINKWKKAAYALDNLPVADVTAGYPKLTKKEKV